MTIRQSKRILLRSIEEADRDEILAMYEAGQRVDRWSPPQASTTSLEQMFERWMDRDASRQRRFVAERRDNGPGPRIANVIALSEIVRGIFQNAYIGWRTHPELLGQGYCTEAVSLALSHAFSERGLHLHRVQAAILMENVASRRVAEKCRFRLEGLARRYLFVREDWRDHLIFAITFEEWRESEPGLFGNRRA